MRYTKIECIVCRGFGRLNQIPFGTKCPFCEGTGIDMMAIVNLNPKAAS